MPSLPFPQQMFAYHDCTRLCAGLESEDSSKETKTGVFKELRLARKTDVRTSSDGRMGWIPEPRSRGVLGEHGREQLTPIGAGKARVRKGHLSWALQSEKCVGQRREGRVSW